MTPQIETESHVIELATEAFNAFCDDVANMFGVGMQCEQQEVRAETVAGLKKCFKKLVAVNVVDATGALEGTFQLLFDQEGLFTLGGVIIMLPEQKILANRKDPSPQLAASMVDAVGEAGNLLVGTWDRIFRKGIRKHGHFLQRLPAFVGKPWDEPQDKIGLPVDAELIYVPYQMTIGSYPSFTCGVIFPKSLFAGHSEVSNESDSEPAAAEESAKKKSKSKRRDAPTTPAKEAEVKENTPDTPAQEAPKDQADSQQVAEAGPQSDGDVTAQEPAPVVTVGAAPRGRPGQPHGVAPTDKSETPCDVSGETPVVEPHDGQDAAPSQEQKEPATGKVSEAIRKMTQSYTAPPDEPDRTIISNTVADHPSCIPAEGKSKIHSFDYAQDGVPVEPQTTHRRRGTVGLRKFLSICAKDVMQSRVVWASPDETVQQALAKMQQYDTGYIMVGVDGVLEGIVSRSDITAALSPYLRSIFGKWRRPLDDATLKIKIKWIMSRPVRTVQTQTPLVTIVENVCRFGGSGLPVVDEQGKVQGLVTVFNIFQTMLSTCANIPTVGRAPQTPPLA